jgi:hypothetical protein
MVESEWNRDQSEVALSLYQSPATPALWFSFWVVWQS